MVNRQLIKTKKSNKTMGVSVRLTPEVLEAVDMVAHMEFRTRASFIEWCVISQLNSYPKHRVSAYQKFSDVWGKNGKD